MFTVKWVKHDIGYEEVFFAEKVWVRNDVDEHCFRAQRGDDILSFSEGHFYVMNENGKTVADYHLPRNKVPTGNPN